MMIPEDLTMKRSKLLTGLMLTLLALPLLASAETPLAVLMSVTGDVTVVRAGGSSVAGSFGMPLENGDEVRTGAGATAEILFDGGNLIAIGANSSTVVKGMKKTPEQAQGAVGVQTASLNEKNFDQVQNFLKLKDSQGTSSLVGLRSGSDADELEATSPVETKIRAERPMFAWRASEDAGEVQVRLYNDSGEIWSHDISSGHACEYPQDAPKLTAGVTYSWTVETTDPLVIPPLRSRAAYFEVMTAQESEEVDASLQKIDAQESGKQTTYHVVRASVFFSYGLMDEAINETMTALKTDPDNPTLQSILARLYAEVGRTGDALGEYNELLDSK